MTIINTSHGFIFIHVPKTGGTSVKEHLRAYRQDRDIYINRPADAERFPAANEGKIRKHSSAVQVREALGSAEFNRLFKFCVVRNPFMRTISLFRFLKFNFPFWPRSELMQEVDSLKKFVVSPIFAGAGPGGIMLPQLHWVADESGASCLDFVARMETLDVDLRDVKNRLALPPSERPLRRRNASKGDAEALASELMSGTVVDAIRNRYTSDFEFFGFSTDPAEALKIEGNQIAD